MTSFSMAYEYEDYVKAIDCGNDVNEIDYDGTTPLFHVSSFNIYGDHIVNYRKIINLFLENGANLDHKDEKGLTALMTSESDYFSLCLLEKGCKICLKNTSSGEITHALIESSIRGHTRSIEYMVKHMGVSVNTKINGETPLNIVLKFLNKYSFYICAVMGIKKLIELGADVNALDKNMFPPIYHSMISYECMFYLINAGANINMELPIDETLLHLSCYENHRISKLLLRNGADENKLTSDGSSPLIRLMNKDQKWSNNDESILCNLLFRSESKCSIVNKNGISILNSKNELPEWIKNFVKMRVKNENWKRRSWILMYKVASENVYKKKESNIIENVIKTPYDIFRKIVEYL